MKVICKRLAFLFVFLFALPLNNLTAETFPVYGTWYVREGFDPSYTSELYEPVTAPRQWLTAKLTGGEYTRENEKNYWHLHDGMPDFKKYNDRNYTGWLTARITLPMHQVQELFSEDSFGISSGLVSDVSKFYINGQYIGGLGSASPYAPGSYMQLLETFPAMYVSDESATVLTVALYSEGMYPFYLKDERMVLGPANEITFRYYFNEIVTLVLLSIYLSVGLYHLLLFIRRRNELYNLYFGLFSLAVTLYWIFRIGSRDLIFGNHVSLRVTIEYIMLFSIGPLLMLFVSQFFKKRHSIIGLIYSGFCAVLAVVTAFSQYPVKSLCLLVWQYSALPFMLYLIYYVVREAVSKNKDAMLMLVGFILLMAGGIHDTLDAIGFFESPHIARYTFVVFVVGIAGILANRFVSVHNQVEELNQNLEQKVKQRTTELQKSLENIQTLKTQQDGDYYLTSLLINPLTGSSVKSGPVGVELITRQKKQFRFRHWHAEIGGDLIAAHSVTLRGIRYTAFVNGDAMGKSIQGAGGALVLGVVFRAILSRTEKSPEISSLYPEKWIRNCFQELQDVFVSFDGSMMMSAVLGLVEDDTGMMYFLNAEHPWTVLYRDQKAQFIERDLILRKIGVAAFAAGLRIKTFAMKPNDVIFTGSDGRDDIMTGMTEDGHRIINEDEQQFLKRVEESDGILEKVYKSLLSYGELTDDLTLLRISYLEDAPLQQDPFPDLASEWNQMKTGAVTGADLAALIDRVDSVVRHENQRAPLKEICSVAAKAKDHTLAVRAFTLYTRRFPDDTEALMKLSYHLKLTGDYTEAVDISERVRLRDKENFKNLINLCDCLRHCGQTERAAKILKEAVLISPEHEHIQLLTEKLGYESVEALKQQAQAEREQIS